MILEVNYNRLPRCAFCNSKSVRKKDSFIRNVHHELIGNRRTILRFKAYKLYCKVCKRYCNQRFPGIAKHQRSTERLQAQIFHQHTYGVSQKTLAQQFKKGKATIERWYHKKYEREKSEIQNAPCPTVLGIDEHFFSRKQGFATTLSNLRKHKIYDIVKGRSEADLNQYLQNLKGKDKVKVVCMYLSNTYPSIVKKHFPNAKIVADRFHVLRLIQHQCMMTYREISNNVKSNRGVLALLRTNPAKLTSNKQIKLEIFLNENPAIKAIYNFQQKLHQLLMRRAMNQDKCRELIPIFLDAIKELQNSAFKHLKALGKTLNNWKEEIVRMWRFRKSNGITEGFHRKMKLIQRRAYGSR